MTAATPRRALLAAALAAATVTAAVSGPAAARGPRPRDPRGTVDNRFWYAYGHWRAGTHQGTVAVPGVRPRLEIGAASDRTEYTDPHTGRTSSWESAVWISPVHVPAVPATEVVPSWNAHTPPGTWLRAELRAGYPDGTRSPWYTMGCWAAGEQDIRRTSVDDQGDGRTRVWTDTLAVAAPGKGPRIADWQLRLTLYRRPGTRLTPWVHLAGAMASDVPDRTEVPASTPTPAPELAVPRRSQEIHRGRYPEYDNGGEAWCSPTSSTMVLEYWGRGPGREELAWVDPAYSDPQVCHAARRTFDHQYKGCGNWSFNAAYAAAYPETAAVVTRLSSLADAERLVRAGIPLITSQSFRKGELTGAGYGTAGHLMTVTGFTSSGDVVANDPYAATNAEVRRVYRRREFENVWLRTKRTDAAGKTASGSGGICYLYVPARPGPVRTAALAAVGVLPEPAPGIR
ncbi:C39 family peptidase [Streptomyces sp. NPDC097619]|uniref:C39 family peptidase n=1 Tax=Streptomyces sp. NPDC097619 TaxID=3157228 RepID=UPI0033221E66